MNQQRGALTAQIARKRKEREEMSPPLFIHPTNNKQNSHVMRGKSVKPHPIIPNTTSSSSSLLKHNKHQIQQQPAVLSPSAVPSSPHGQRSSNRILAGYLAHEFLTRGTLFGQKFDPEVGPGGVASPAGDQWRKKLPASVNGSEGGGGAQATGGGDVMKFGAEEKRSYAEVSSLLMSDGGVHIPGIVNPTQLARWIQKA